MVIDGDIITLDKKEVKALVNKECRDKFGVDAAVFLRKYRRGELSINQESAVPKIKMLLRLAYK